MTLADLFDAVVRLSLVLFTLSGLAAIEMILAARMLMLPSDPAQNATRIAQEQNHVSPKR
jgi:hypothetical protein